MTKRQYQRLNDLMCGKEFRLLTFGEAFAKAYLMTMQETVALWFWME